MGTVCWAEIGSGKWRADEKVRSEHRVITVTVQAVESQSPGNGG